jgi:hypothetical protein
MAPNQAVAGNFKAALTDSSRSLDDLLSPQVQAILGSFDDPMSLNSFPQYPTFDTGLEATEINLLASLAAWVVGAESNRQAFLDMYQ